MSAALFDLSRVFFGGRRRQEPFDEDDDDGYEGDVFSSERRVAAKRPLRLLCLHGRGSNNDITSIQLVSLNLHTAAKIDLLQGGIEAEPATVAFDQLSQRSFRSWFDDSAGVERAMLRVLRAIRQHGPYDGIYGFSQGAAVAAFLSIPGIAEKLGGTRDWRFIICACGVATRLAEVRASYMDHRRDSEANQKGENGDASTSSPKSTIDLPSLHIIGEKDPYKNLSRNLVGACDSPIVVTHPHGHELPVSLRTNSHFQTQVRNFLSEQLEN